MIKTILVPTDGSDHAVKAATLAADIAGKYDAKLVFLHVLPHGPLPPALQHMAEVEHLVPGREPGTASSTVGTARVAIPITEASNKENNARQVYQAVAEKLLADAESIARKRGVKRFEKITEDGDAAKRIIEQARKCQANLIVMGSRGLTDLKGLLMGSVSHKVSHLAECSCITVR
jgi:nucleotide-binding universal stress UspA family protein